MLVAEKWEFSDSQWMVGDVKSMEIAAPDTSQAFKLDVLLKHDREYAFQNLYIKTNTTYPSGKVVSSVTSLELSDKVGNWSGDCTGQTCSIELPLQRHFTFPEPGVYTWTIEPYMRIDTIDGIQSLTVLCSKATQ